MWLPSETQKPLEVDSASESTTSSSVKEKLQPPSGALSFEVPTDRDVLHSSYIYKLVAGEDPHNIDNWVRRQAWLTRAGGFFYYSVTHNRPLARHITGLCVKKHNYITGLFSFELRPNSERPTVKSTFLSTDTSEERNVWISCLTSIDGNPDHKHDLAPLDFCRELSRSVTRRGSNSRTCSRSQTPDNASTRTARGRAGSRDSRFPRRGSNASTGEIEDSFWLHDEMSSFLPVSAGRAPSMGRAEDQTVRWSDSLDAEVPDEPLAKLTDKSCTALILDWDDTICPTTWLRDDACVKWNLPLESQLKGGNGARENLVRKLMSAISEGACSLLSEAVATTTVFIVTLARKPWVETSTEFFMPALSEYLQGTNVKVIYAQEYINEDLQAEYDREEFMSSDQILDFWTNVKAEAIGRELRDSDPSELGGRWKNVISFGDSDFERYGTIDACEDYIKSSGSSGQQLHKKTVKLVNVPTVEELTAQLALLVRWLPFIIRHVGDLDYEIEDTVDDQALSDLHASITGEIASLSWRELAGMNK